MNKKTLAAALFIVLVASTLGLIFPKVAADSLFIGPIIWVDEPAYWKVYTNTTVPLDIVAIVRNGTTEVVSFSYSLDGGENVTLANVTRLGSVGGYEFHGYSILKNLAEGNHTLRVYSVDHAGFMLSDSTEFMIDTHFANPITLMSPQNKTYTATDGTKTNVSLSFSSSLDVMWMSYRLDEFGGAPVKDGRISGNFTLTDLPLGHHKVSVDVGTVRGPYTQTVEFTVAKPEPFPTVLVTAVSVVIAAIIVTSAILLTTGRHPKTNFGSLFNGGGFWYERCGDANNR